jgi:hypothetical protein
LKLCVAFEGFPRGMLKVILSQTFMESMALLNVGKRLEAEN